MPDNKSIGLNRISIKALSDYFNKTLKGVSKLSVDKFIKDTLSLERAEEQFSLLKKSLPIDIENKKLLEIGSGFGTFIVSLRINHNLLSYGAEPDFICRKTSQEILATFGIAGDIISNNAGENLSYIDNSFDIVYSTNVLEHVQSPEKVFSEAIRVLKPQGYLFFVVPNFASCWEGHYGILWPPNMPKYLARWYVKLLGRDPRYIDQLQLVTLKQLIDITRKFKEQLEVLDWGWDVWEYRLTTLDFSGWADLYKLKKMLQILNKSRLLGLIRYLGKRLGWLTPIILVAKKK